MKLILSLVMFLYVTETHANSVIQDVRIDSSRYIYKSLIHDESRNEFDTEIYKKEPLSYSQRVSLYGLSDCSLGGEGLQSIKDVIAGIIRDRIPQAAQRALKNESLLSVYLLPRFEGKIDAVWFHLYKKGAFPFTEDEMDLLITEVKKVHLKFEFRRDSTKKYCQYLYFVFTPKDWEKIIAQSQR